ncbi:hypothetical protein [Geodermatophilus chilensis]|uniref:hypothetical protein n=1 Tax=Geodermatophilus chilensis TaxID=2035835 RepID=UPI001E41F0AF|nr:hypothetical protein [Geodermatophilus chilensis]
MAKRIPDSTKHSLHWRLADRARERWPDLAEVRMRYRAGFAYVEGVLAAGPVIPLCRLRYLGSAGSSGSWPRSPREPRAKGLPGRCERCCAACWTWR